MLPKVMADRVQLQQVFMNLMLNGIDAMKNLNGTGELIIKSQQTGNDQLLISVSDTGVGLPAERADQIFEAFFTPKPQALPWGYRLAALHHRAAWRPFVGCRQLRVGCMLSVCSADRDWGQAGVQATLPRGSSLITRNSKWDIEMPAL
jgi:Histidine kinase-, DNA gyrase B-, and HSP90-like ATPase